MTDLEDKSEKFTMEWARLRFGVFSEAGFAGDYLYPESFEEGQEVILNAGCDEKVQVGRIFFSDGPGEGR